MLSYGKQVLRWGSDREALGGGEGMGDERDLSWEEGTALTFDQFL